jgi:hypothetical protein
MHWGFPKLFLDASTRCTHTIGIEGIFHLAPPTRNPIRQKEQAVHSAWRPVGDAAAQFVFTRASSPSLRNPAYSGHLDSFWPIRHPVTCIQTRAGALTNLLPRQGGLPKGDVAEKWQM